MMKHCGFDIRLHLSRMLFWFNDFFIFFYFNSIFFLFNFISLYLIFPLFCYMNMMLWKRTSRFSNTFFNNVVCPCLGPLRSELQCLIDSFLVSTFTYLVQFAFDRVFHFLFLVTSRWIGKELGARRLFGFMCGFPSLSRHDSELIIIHANAMSHISFAVCL